MLVLNEFVGQSRSQDALVVGNTLGFYPFAVGFLFFFFQHEFHFLRLLLCIDFGFDGLFHRFGQLDIADQQVFQHDAALCEFFFNSLENLLLKFLAFSGIQCYSIVKHGVVAYFGAGNRAHNHIFDVLTDRTKNIRRFFRNDVVQYRKVNNNLQTIGGEHPDGIITFLIAFVVNSRHGVILGADIKMHHIHQRVYKI